MSNTAGLDELPAEQESLTARVLDYWFGEFNDETPISMTSEQYQRWHGKSPQTDTQIRARFLRDYRRPSQWQAEAVTARGRLTLVILFDQFPRNMFRNTPAMYEADSLALAICLNALDRGLDQQLTLIERMFLYMPLMHAENLELQNRMLNLFRAQSPVNVGFFEMAHSYARHHRHIIEKFGRFPHCNAVLGRTSTAEEVEFLKQPDSAF